MFKKIKRFLFPRKYLLRDNSNQQIKIEQALAGSSPQVKELARFFVDNRDEAKGQLLQDLWAVWETKGKEGGYFVEFGAASGFELSNTCLLEQKYGWSGILSEPMPFWLPQLKERKATLELRCVWKTSKEKLSFLCSDQPEYSGLTETAAKDGHAKRRKKATSIEVETVSLLDMLDQHRAPKVIDYLSMDTEGSEFAILEPFDFSRYQFNLITVEHNFSKSREELHTLLTKNGYLRVFEELSCFDDWYVHKSMRPGKT